MSDPELFNQAEIDQQQSLLATYRRTLAHLLQQAAQHGGEVNAPPSVRNGVDEARENIRRIKAILHAHNASVADHPDDEPPTPYLSTSPAFWPAGGTTQSAGTQRNVTTGVDYAEGNIDKRQGAFVDGGTIYGPVVGSNMGTITTNYGSPLPASPPSGLLEQALAQVQQAASLAQQRGDDD